MTKKTRKVSDAKVERLADGDADTKLRNLRRWLGRLGQTARDRVTVELAEKWAAEDAQETSE